MDYIISIIIGSSFIFIGLLLFGLAIPLYKGSVKMNRVYGARFKKSFESDGNWYKINKHSGKLMMIWSLPLIILGVVCFFITFNVFLLVLFCVLFMVFILIPVMMSYNFARKL
jgi:hypothetical protein